MAVEAEESTQERGKKRKEGKMRMRQQGMKGEERRKMGCKKSEKVKKKYI